MIDYTALHSRLVECTVVPLLACYCASYPLLVCSVLYILTSPQLISHPHVYTLKSCSTRLHFFLNNKRDFLHLNRGCTSCFISSLHCLRRKIILRIGFVIMKTFLQVDNSEDDGVFGSVTQLQYANHIYNRTSIELNHSNQNLERQTSQV